MAIAPDDLEPARIATAINDLLIRHGYPPGRVSDWWDHQVYAGLDGRTPTQAWNDHEYRRVLEVLRAGYAASQRASERLSADPKHAALIDDRLVELHRRYDN